LKSCEQPTAKKQNNKNKIKIKKERRNKTKQKTQKANIARNVSTQK
jgi:hypothetical protein